MPRFNPALGSLNLIHASTDSDLLENAGLGQPERRQNPLNFDPTRTTLIRRQFAAELTRRYLALIREIERFLVENDTLGLGEVGPVTLAQPGRRAYAFNTDAEKLHLFNEWLRRQMEETIMALDPSAGIGQISQGPWTLKYIQRAYQRGRLNAFLRTRRAQAASAFGVTFEEVLQLSTRRANQLQKMLLLGTRSFEQLRGVNAAMAAEMNRILSQGLIDKRSPEYLARQMVASVRGLSKSRALLIAQTETIYAHAEGQLDAFEEEGIEEIQVRAEWVTAGDSRVCPLCQANEGKTFTIEAARGLIPLHPRCRCSWVPVRQKVKTKKR